MYMHAYIREREIGEREAWGDGEDGSRGRERGRQNTQGRQGREEEGEKGEDNVGGLSRRL